MNYLHHSAPIAEALSNPRLIFTTKVIQNFENPKINAQFSLREPIFYTNAEYAVRITIGIKGGKYYYDHSLTSIEKGNLIEIAQGFTPNGGRTLPSYAVSKDTRIIPILQTNSSKIVDANGEPKVVYHRTPNKFTAFDVDKIGSSL